MDCPVKILIDETSDAYANYDSVNADYAAFASMALDEFKGALKDPDLTGQRLRSILRQGAREHKLLDNTARSWSGFMARYVMKNVNGNIQDV